MNETGAAETVSKVTLLLMKNNEMSDGIYMWLHSLRLLQKWKIINLKRYCIDLKQLSSTLSRP